MAAPPNARAAISPKSPRKNAFIDENSTRPELIQTGALATAANPHGSSACAGARTSRRGVRNVADIDRLTPAQAAADQRQYRRDHRQPCKAVEELILRAKHD